MTTSFVHLHVHSEYSIFDSVISIEPLLDACVKANMPAVAITDLNNLFGAVKFYKKAINKGIKPILGAEVWVQQEGMITKLVLLCQNDTGLNQLRRLVTRGYLKAPRQPIPLMPAEWLEAHADGLLAIFIESPTIQTACAHGELEHAKHLLQPFKDVFPDRFYLGLNRVKEDDNQWQHLIKLAQATQTPVVATNAACFVNAHDFEAHEARVCIQEGTTLAGDREKRFSPEQYIKTPEQMSALFAQVPSAIENTLEIAKRCNVQLVLGEAHLPPYPVPDDQTIESHLRGLAKSGLDKRWQKIKLRFEEEDQEKAYQSYCDRLATELEVINSMGFAGYFLIVADFIQWAKRNDIPVGPGRGSGAGSIVAYALDITDLDPIQYDLLFERFLNPERVSMPDFDVDFCMENRDKVIEYVAQKYGQKSVAQIATFGTMAAKAVVRDVGRVLGHPYGFVDKIAKLIPFDIGMTLSKALIEEEALAERYKKEEEVRFLIDLAKKLEGKTRNVGKHAGGVVIAPTRLTEYTPLYCEEGSTQVVTQYDKDDVEAIGLVKFDFLGLRTLTIIHWAVQNANKYSHEKVNINDIPLDCAKTYDLLKACKTTAVFQLESRGMKELIHRLQPDEFEEIIALVALFRPGPLQSGMVDDFIDRKHGRAKVEYPHPELEPILKPTYGVILYQEQVMQIAQSLAGYTLGGADLLRRAMGKKKPEEMAKQREIFVKGATERGIEEETATYIFDLMEKFAGYGFNKSHSAAYALVSYQTAWLKAHHPSAFMASVLSSDMNQTEKVVVMINEVKKLNLKWHAPNINESFYRFALNKEGVITYGMGAIKGVGEGAIESILDARFQEGPFKDLFDFCERVDTRKVNKRVLEALIKCGAMDCFGQPRHILFATMERAFKQAEQKNHDDLYGQVDMFAQEEAQAPQWVDAKPWSDDDTLKYEKETLGFYLSGHPMDNLRRELSHFVTHRLGELPPREMKVVVAGIINQMRTLQTKKGDRMAFVTLDDNTEPFEVAIFSDLYQKRREFINKDDILVVTGTLSYDKENQQIRLRAEDIYDLAHARARYAKRLSLSIQQPSMAMEDMIQGLRQLMAEQKGTCYVSVKYATQDITAKLAFGETWRILPSQYLIDTLKNHFGEDALELEY